ncbi:MAG: TIR domain-containing protein [bacterium]|nr:TIR domain-containing protein [bacterium]
MFLEQQGVVQKIDVTKGNHRWQNRLRVSAPRDKIEALSALMKNEFEKRATKPDESKDGIPPMNKSAIDVLIAWSKTQSKVVASALHAWLPTVVPGIKPWMSDEDIAKGREWFPELQHILSQTRVCIICVTPENVRSPWIYYEAGAIAAKGPDVVICPYLVGVSPSMLADGPLRQWQCTTADREDTWKLIKSLNSNALPSPHDLSLLQGNFGAQWPHLAAQIQPVAEMEVDEEEAFVTTDADQLAGANLSAEARTMVLEVSKDPDGMLLYFRVAEGTSFQAHGVNLCPDQSPRTLARWKAAIDNLAAYGILEPRGYDGDTFALTAKGYEVADALRGEGSSELENPP